MGDRLIDFYGTECVHCKEMDSLIEKLENEEGVKVTKLEVWHNSQNAALMKELDKDENGSTFCGGVPFFYNEKTGKKICGNTTYEKFKEWALGG
ncbi:MAG: thioredoxin family protein [Candidatus Brocadiales bacterium]|nr:thioredoxin family protein [Candidatus Bathyanammoxibius sp.]